MNNMPSEDDSLVDWLLVDSTKGGRLDAMLVCVKCLRGDDHFYACYCLNIKS
jgi:hypothetical protein